MISDDESSPTSAGMGPSDETTIVPPTAAPPGHAWSEEEPTTEALSRPWRSAWVIAGIGLGCAVVVALAIFGVALLKDQAIQPAPTTPMQAASEPAVGSPAVAPPTTTWSVSSSRLPGTDDLGWTAYRAARCDPGDRPAVMGRTPMSVVVVCEIQPGNFYYRGLRLRDGASIELANAVRSSESFDVTNPTDGTRYRIGPTTLAIAPPDGPVSSEQMLEFASTRNQR